MQYKHEPPSLLEHPAHAGYDGYDIMERAREEALASDWRVGQEWVSSGVCPYVILYFADGDDGLMS